MDVQSQISKSIPEPPPTARGLFLPLGTRIPRELQQHAWAALKMYLDAIRVCGKPWPGWESFERELASEFATLLLFLRVLPQERPRCQVLDLFLTGLNLENKRGRARKAIEKLAAHIHGKRMVELWERELQEAWNMKVSLERARSESLARLKKRGFPDDVVQAVCGRRASPESSLAKVYAQRQNVSEGWARNALRAYMRLTNKIFAAQV